MRKISKESRKAGKETERKTKGKRHPLHAESLDRMADEAENTGEYTLAGIFRREARRVREILR